jgi:nucleoside-diphosphate-sugar epimerase
VKQLIITASIVSLVSTSDFWKEITITEKCEFSQLNQQPKINEEWIELTLYDRPPLPVCALHVAYNPQTAEDAFKPDAPAFLVYSVSKGLADRAVRDFKRAHPDLDVTTIHPGYVFGPLGSGQVYNSPATGSNRYIYGLIAGSPDRPVSEYDPAVRAPPLNVDVRDVARAHVLALKVPPSDEPKRFILSSSTFTWKEAIEFIAKARPELKGRLPVVTGNEPALPPFAALDISATENVLGLKNFVKWQDTVLDTIDDLLRVEKELAASAQ